MTKKFRPFCWLQERGRAGRTLGGALTISEVLEDLFRQYGVAVWGRAGQRHDKKPLHNGHSRNSHAGGVSESDSARVQLCSLLSQLSYLLGFKHLTPATEACELDCVQSGCIVREVDLCDRGIQGGAEEGQKCRRRGFGEGLGSRRPTNDSKIHPHHLHLSHYLKQEVSKQDFGKTGQHHHRHDETSASHAEDLRLFPRLRLSASRPGSASNWTARFRPALGSCWCLERSVNQMPVPPPVPQRCRHRYRKALLPSPRRKGRQVPPAPCRCSLPLHC